MRQELSTDNRGQTASKAVSLVVLLAVMAIIGSVLLPVAINEIESTTSTTLTQDEGVTYDVNGELTSNVTNVDGTNSQATVVLNDTRTATTTSKTIGVGATSSYSLQGGTVNVTVDSLDTTATPSTATVTYEYDKEYAYSGGASSIWGLLGLTIVLALFLFLLSATGATNRI